MTTLNFGPHAAASADNGEGAAPLRHAVARWRRLVRLWPRGWSLGYHPEKRYMRGPRPGA